MGAKPKSAPVAGADSIFLAPASRRRLFFLSSHELEVARRRATLLQIFLVIFLRSVKRPRRSNFRRDRPLEFSARVQFRLHLLRNRFLLRRMKENRRPILRTEVWALPIHLR